MCSSFNYWTSCVSIKPDSCTVNSTADFYAEAQGVPAGQVRLRPLPGLLSILFHSYATSPRLRTGVNRKGRSRLRPLTGLLNEQYCIHFSIHRLTTVLWHNEFPLGLDKAEAIIQAAVLAVSFIC